MFNRSFFSNLPPVTKNLLIINVIIWAFMAIVPNSTADRVMQLGGLHYVTSPGFGIWQFFTYMFIHANFMHLFFNMWALLIFGFLIENFLGSKRYLFYYLSCGVGAAIIQMIVFAIMIANVSSGLNPATVSSVTHDGWNLIKEGLTFRDPVLGELNGLINGTTVGASGAVFGILLAVAMIYPNLPMYIMFIPVPVKAKWMVLAYGAVEVFLGVATPSDGVAHFAHLGGMLFGFIMLWYWKRQSRGNGVF